MLINIKIATMFASYRLHWYTNFSIIYTDFCFSQYYFLRAPHLFFNHSIYSIVLNFALLLTSQYIATLCFTLYYVIDAVHNARASNHVPFETGQVPTYINSTDREICVPRRHYIEFLVAFQQRISRSDSKAILSKLDQKSLREAGAINGVIHTIQVPSRQTRKLGPALARLRVYWPNIVPYIRIHWANFPGLSGLQ